MNLQKYINTPHEHLNEMLKVFTNNDEIVIFDIGACEAEDSIKFSNIFPNSKIFSFEPILDNFLKCQENVKLYNKESIYLFNQALSDFFGEEKIYVSSGHPQDIVKTNEWSYGNKSSSLLPPKEVLTHYSWLKFNTTETVKVNTFKKFCIDNQIEYVDFVHIDVQGAELKVLKGMEDLIEKITLIILEVEAIPLYEKQPLKSDIENFMIQKGFTKTKDTTDSISGDQIYVKNKK